jgi:hypothetical protein
VRASSPELAVVDSFFKDEGMDALIQQQEQTDLFSLFHNLRMDEKSSCDMSRSLPVDTFPPPPWTFGTASNPPPAKRSPQSMSTTV